MSTQSSDYNESKRLMSLKDGGWQVKPLNIDIDWYVNKRDTMKVLADLAPVFSTIMDNLFKSNRNFISNILSMWGSEVNSSINNLIDKFIPAFEAPPSGKLRELNSMDAYIKNDANNASEMVIAITGERDYPNEKAFKELKREMVKRILNSLGPYDYMIQRVGTSEWTLPFDRVNGWNSVNLVGNDIWARWNDLNIWLHIINRGWEDAQVFLYYSDKEDMLERLNTARLGTAILIAGYDTRVGQVNARFKLDSFPQYVQEMTKDWKDTIIRKLEEDSKYSAILLGPPGCGYH